MKILHLNYFILFVVLCMTSDAKGSDYREYQTEKRIILKDGLSQNRILSILEDDFGFMWFGTADGLNRYDGYEFNIFRNRFDDTTSLPNNSINTMVEDSDGNFWIGTNNGISIFNPYSNKALNYYEEDTIAAALGAGFITASAIDKNDNVWFGTDGYGITRINTRTHEKKYFFYSVSDSIHLNSISNLFIDSQNRLWFGTFVGDKVWYYDIDNDKLESVNISLKKYENNRNAEKVFAIYEDPSNRVWISIVNYEDTLGGIYYNEQGTDEFLSYHSIFGDDNYEYHYDRYNTIHSITGDSLGNIWFSSVLGGLFKFKFGETPQAYYVESPVSDSRINLIYRSTNGLIWIGTNGHGLEISVPSNTEFNTISEVNHNNFEIESIRAICEGKDSFWIGGYYGLAKVSKDFKKIKMVHYASVYSLATTDEFPNHILTGSEGGGLRLLNTLTEEMVDFEYKKNDINPLYMKYVFVIYPLNDTLLLLGTSNGLYGINKQSHKTYRFPYNVKHSKEIGKEKSVRTIYKDNDDNILIGYVKGGVGILNLQDHAVDVFSKLPDFADFHNFNPINCIYQDKSDRYWLATSNGLLKLSDNKDFFILISEQNGLPNSHLYSILPDHDNNLWMSSNNGLCCYSPDENIFRNYDISDGLQNNEFNTGAYYSSLSGDLFFGGIHGFNYFNPEKIKQNSIIPKLQITGIRQSNNRVYLSKDELEKGIVEIPADNEVFTIEFAGLSYINSQNNNYKYFVHELGDEWINIEHQHEITFYGLAPGTYNVEILASNNHGLWLKKPKTLQLVVLPKFYETLVFKWIMIVLLFLIIILGIRLRIRSITKQKDKLQKLVDEQTHTLKETNMNLREEVSKHSKTTNELKKTIVTKDKFLSIIAHDIIGPLGVIQGFSDLLIDNRQSFTKGETNNFYKTINITVKQLSALLSNLLQWSRLQSQSIIPVIRKINILEVTLEVVSLLLGSLDDKNINLDVEIDSKYYVFADKNMLQTILRNIISNSIKFTKDGGSIAIGCANLEDTIEIRISDTGIGMNNKYISDILNPDINFTTKGTKNESGTGLGLNLVNEFVNMNGGKMKIESKLGSGSVFYFTLPSNPPIDDKI